MRKFCVGSKSINVGSTKEQVVAYLLERGLGYTETTILINRDSLQKSRNTIICSTVHTCTHTMMRKVSNIERRPQGKKDVDSMWPQPRRRWATQLMVRLGLDPDLSQNF